jgi:hypothetical protein
MNTKLVTTLATKWAKKFDCCIECKTKARKHACNGRCTSCHNKYIYATVGRPDRKPVDSPRLNAHIQEPRFTYKFAIGDLIRRKGELNMPLFMVTRLYYYGHYARCEAINIRDGETSRHFLISDCDRYGHMEVKRCDNKQGV